MLAGAERPLDAGLDSTGKRAPSAVATAPASSIIARTTAMLGAWAPISATVAIVSALTGLNETLPHSLSQMSSRMRRRTGARNPAPWSAAAISWTRGVTEPSGSPSINRSPPRCRTTPGSITSHDG